MSGSALEGGAVFESEGQAAIRVGCGVVQQVVWTELLSERQLTARNRDVFMIPAAGIDDLCARLEVTPGSFLQAAFAETVRRICRENKAVYTTVSNGRSADPALLGCVGMFVRTIPVVTMDTGSMTTEAYIRAMHKQLLESFSMEFYPYTRVVERHRLKAELMFVYQGGIEEGEEDHTEREIDLELDAVKLPVTVMAWPEGQSYVLSVEYDGNRYGMKEMERFAKAFGAVCEGFTRFEKVSEVSLVSGNEEEELISISKGRELAYNTEKTWIDLFLAQAEKHPDKTAVVDSKGSFTYEELNRASDAVAAWLIRSGVQENSFVAVKMDRVKEFMAAIIGIQKAGAAYVPIDPDYPPERIAYMQEDSEASVLLTEDMIGQILTEAGETVPVNRTTVGHRAYMIYTSGSTGKPKGVVIPQSSLMAYAAWSSREYGYREDRNFAHCVSFSFDVSVTDLVDPMITGAELHIISVEMRRDLSRLAGYLKENRIYGIKFPTQLGMLMLNSFPDMYPAFTVLGGEKLLPVARTHVLQYNEYGPTEFTVGSDVHLVDQDKDEDIPIGFPVPNSWSFVCDSYGNLLPYGYVGELCLAGAQIAEGYWKRPELTTEKFCPCPLLPGRKMYRTGDLVRYNANGELECLAEVRNGQLVLYYTHEKSIDSGSLRSYLAKSLTYYMVPSVYVPMDAMPVTPVGKIDRKALPDIESGETDRTVLPPETPLQEQLCGLFREVLSLEKVGINENFFDLGGSSLMASVMLMKAKLLELPLNYQDIFDHPTVMTLEELILSKREKEKNRSCSDRQPVTAAPSEKNKEEFACLKKNKAEYLDELTAEDLGPVLIVGATGFLGAHIVKGFLDMTDQKIYCLVRHADTPAADRFLSVMFYYFEINLEHYLEDRIIVIEGDPVSGQGMEETKKHEFRTVINCAASVKHFADIELLMEANVKVVDKLIDLCLEKRARLIQTSTISVGGDIPVQERERRKLTEDKHNIGQITKMNGYVHTKYMAEEHVLRAICEKKLDAKIMRLGNLMSRSTDGEFQMNFNTNNFFRTLWAYAALGCVPVSTLDEKVEYSPINETAKAILLLSGTSGEFTVFHPYNSHTVEMGDIILSMNSAGFPVRIVNDREFDESLKKAMADEKLAASVAPLLVYETDESRTTAETEAENHFTTKALYRLGFKWSLTDLVYIENALRKTASLIID